MTFNAMTIRHGNAPSSSDGGGIFCESGNLTVNDSKVTLNYTPYSGGGIYFDIVGFVSETLTIQNSSIDNNQAGVGGDGGGIYVDCTEEFLMTDSRVEYNKSASGGGMFFYSIVDGKFTDSHISHNEATSTNGGGIYMHNDENHYAIDLHLTRCTLDNNTADSFGGAIFSDQYHYSRMLMDDCVVSDNTATGNNGGGIYWTSDGEVRINRSSFHGNNTGADGGAIYIYLSDEIGFFIVDSVFYNNTAASDGGAIYNNETLFITQSTISGNAATNGNGGGILSTYATLQLKHVTIADNHAVNGNGGGIYSDRLGFDVMEHTILGDNTAGTGHDCFITASIASEHHNLIENTTGYAGTFSGTDIVGSDPLLATLADNGGPTQTHALQDTSPAIDAGDPTFPDPNPLLPNDQRTSPFLRVIDGTIDIGAYESGNVDPIPTMNEWGMLILALLISGSAVWSLRRKRKEL